MVITTKENNSNQRDILYSDESKAFELGFLFSCRLAYFSIFSATSAKSPQSCLTLCNPWQPTRLPHPRDSPGKNTGVGCHCLLQCMKVKSEREVAQSCPTLSDPMDCSLPGFPSMGFSRQEYWSGVPLPSPEWVAIPFSYHLLEFALIHALSQ